MRLDEIKQLTETVSHYYFSDESMHDVIAAMSHEMDLIAHKFKDKQVTADSVPSAPNSSVFRANRSGMITHEENVAVHGGQYGSSKLYADFIKIGGNVELATKRAIIADVATAMDDFSADLEAPGFKIPGTMNCLDGKVFVDEEHGTNWGGVGIFAREYSAYDRKTYLQRTGDDEA